MITRELSLPRRIGQNSRDFTIFGTSLYWLEIFKNSRHGFGVGRAITEPRRPL
jgi:hypothetical protein